MFYTCIGVFLALFFLNVIIRKKIFCASNYMLVFWIISLLINKYSFIVYYYISEKTYMIIFLGIVFFFIGSLIADYLCKRRIRIKVNRNRHNDQLNDQILYFISIVHLMVTIYFAYKMFGYYLEGYSFSQLRSVYQGYETGIIFAENQIEELLLHWIQMPLNSILPLIAIVTLVQKCLRLKIFYAITIIDQVLIALYSQSRANIFYLFLFLVVILWNYRDILSKKTKRKIIISVTIVLAIVIVFTIVRFEQSSQWKGLRSYILYLSGGISLLNYGINDLDTRSFSSYGANFFYGWYVILSNLIRLLPIEMSEFTKLLMEIEGNQEIFIRIGPAAWLNAYYTFFYDFYLDFGIMSVIIESFLFGVWSEYRINKMIINRDSVELVCKGLITCLVLFMSMIRWQFASPTFCFSYIYIYLIFKLPIKIKSQKQNVVKVIRGLNEKK